MVLDCRWNWMNEWCDVDIGQSLVNGSKCKLRGKKIVESYASRTQTTTFNQWKEKSWTNRMRITIPILMIFYYFGDCFQKNEKKKKKIRRFFQFPFVVSFFTIPDVDSRIQLKCVHAMTGSVWLQCFDFSNGEVSITFFQTEIKFLFESLVISFIL